MGHSEFDVITDSHAVTYLQSTKNFSAKLARISLFLGDFNFKVIHKPGASHTNADGLSRCPREGTDPDLEELTEIHELEASEDLELCDFLDHLEDEESNLTLCNPDDTACAEATVQALNVSRYLYLESIPCQRCN